MAPEQFRNQDYRKLKKQCGKKGELFLDAEFPPAQSSLFLDPNKDVSGGVEWKRPGVNIANAIIHCLLLLWSFSAV